MSEYLKEVTDLLHYKNIIPAIELSKVPVPESDPVTRMSLLLPKPRIVDGKDVGIDNKEEIKVVRLPFEYDDSMSKITPTTLNVNVMSADGRVIGFHPSDDVFFESTNESAFSRELFIPNGEEQISFRQAVGNNTENLIHDRLGLDPDEYSDISDFRLFARYLKSQNFYRMQRNSQLHPMKRIPKSTGGVDVYDSLVVNVDIKTKLPHKDILGRLQSESIESDLLPENIVVLNSREINEAQRVREANIRELGRHGLLAGVDFIMSALKKI